MSPHTFMSVCLDKSEITILLFAFFFFVLEIRLEEFGCWLQFLFLSFLL